MRVAATVVVVLVGVSVARIDLELTRPRAVALGWVMVVAAAALERVMG